jgi:hypothetical protein
MKPFYEGNRQNGQIDQRIKEIYMSIANRKEEKGIVTISFTDNYWDFKKSFSFNRNDDIEKANQWYNNLNDIELKWLNYWRLEYNIGTKAQWEKGIYTRNKRKESTNRVELFIKKIEKEIDECLYKGYIPGWSLYNTICMNNDIEKPTYYESYFLNLNYWLKYKRLTKVIKNGIILSLLHKKEKEYNEYIKPYKGLNNELENGDYEL